MKRLGLLFMMLALIVAAVAMLSPSTSTKGQDQTDERLAALETQVSDQSDDISGLKTRVRDLETAVAGISTSPGDVTAAETPESPDQSGMPGSFVVQGTGSIVTENYRIEAGRYQVQLQLVGGCCISIFVYGEHGDSDLIAGEIFSGEGGSTSFIYEFTSGEYFFEARNTDAHWSLSFVPR